MPTLNDYVANTAWWPKPGEYISGIDVRIKHPVTGRMNYELDDLRWPLTDIARHAALGLFPHANLTQAQHDYERSKHPLHLPLYTFDYNLNTGSEFAQNWPTNKIATERTTDVNEAITDVGIGTVTEFDSIAGGMFDRSKYTVPSNPDEQAVLRSGYRWSNDFILGFPAAPSIPQTFALRVGAISNRHRAAFGQPKADPVVEVMALTANPPNVANTTYTNNCEYPTEPAINADKTPFRFVKDKFGNTFGYNGDTRLCVLKEAEVINCCLGRPKDGKTCNAKFDPKQSAGRAYCDAYMTKWCERPENKEKEECGCFLEVPAQTEPGGPGYDIKRLKEIYGDPPCWYAKCTNKSYKTINHIEQPTGNMTKCRVPEAVAFCSIINSPTTIAMIAPGAKVQTNTQECNAVAAGKQAEEWMNSSGKVVKCTPTGEIYRIEGRKKRKFATPKAYDDAGRPQFEELPTDCSALNAIPDGEPIPEKPAPANSVTSNPPAGTAAGAPPQAPPPADTAAPTVPGAAADAGKPTTPPPAEPDDDEPENEPEPEQKQTNLMPYLLAGGGLLVLMFLMLLLI